MGSLASFTSSYYDGGCFLKAQNEIKDSTVRKFLVRASVASSTPKSLNISEIKAQKSEKFRIGVLGASGYTGSEGRRLRRVKASPRRTKKSQVTMNLKFQYVRFSKRWTSIWPPSLIF